MIFFESIGLDIGYMIIGILFAIFLLLTLYIIILVQNNKLKKKYLRFMEGADGKTLEAAVLAKFDSIDQLKREAKNLRSDVDFINERLLSTFQYVSLVKYDAFNQMGGKLSFSICMLDARKNGFVLTSMHSSREGCYTYIKEIISGESYVLLSEEETKALSEAKDKAITSTH